MGTTLKSPPQNHEGAPVANLVLSSGDAKPPRLSVYLRTAGRCEGA